MKYKFILSNLITKRFLCFAFSRFELSIKISRSHSDPHAFTTSSTYLEKRKESKIIGKWKETAQE